MDIDYLELLRSREEERDRVAGEIQRLKEAERNQARLEKEIQLLKQLAGLKAAPGTARGGRGMSPDSLPSRALRVLQDHGKPMPLHEIAKEVASRHGFDISTDLMKFDLTKRVSQAMAGRPTRFRFLNRSEGWTLIPQQDETTGARANNTTEPEHATQG